MPKTTAALSVGAALLTCAAANAAIWTFTCDAPASDSLSALGSVRMTLTLGFDENASALNGATAITSWNYRITQPSTGSGVMENLLFERSSVSNAVSSNYATFERWTMADGTSTRRYTVVLGDGSNTGWTGAAVGMNLPKISLVQIGFVAARSGTTYGNMAESLTQSAGSGGGFLSLVATAVPGTSSFGAITGFGFAVPAPSAAALIGLSGLILARRRRD